MTRPHLAAALLAVALSACTAHEARTPQGTAPRYASLDALALGSTGSPAAAPVRAATPLVVLPAWIGRPTRLREREDADTYEQAISLGLGARSEARENLALVTVPRSDAALARLTTASPTMGRPTEAAIRAEIDAAFPGTAMQVVTRPAANAYGPYGLAVGRTARGARCLYAWQWIEAPPSLDPARSGPVSLRIRLCRDDVTLEAMAAAVNELRLVPRWQGEAVTAAPAVTVRRKPRRMVAAVAGGEAASPPRTPLRREAGVRTEPGFVETHPERGGRRYLGADPGPVGRSDAAEAGSLRGLRAGGGPVAPAPGIAADLPPEAYRGPARP